VSELVIIEIIKTTTTVLTAIIAGFISIKLTRLHRQINSRMTEMLENQKRMGHAEGKLEEADDERKRKSV